MSDHIRLLDCTLRDGGHINNGVFGEAVIKNVIKDLVDARLDIIEVGFLWDTVCDRDTARFHTIEDVKRILPKSTGVSKFSLMADFIDLDHIEPYDGTIEYIRLSFKRHRLEWGLRTAQILMNKGYNVFINPVNCNVYTDEEYLAVIKKVNELKPFGFSIVDTFGVMRKRDLTRIVALIDHNLDSDITVGLHLHENLGLAYSLAQHYIEISNPRRDIIIDCSLLGMGRVPGNLCTEQIMDHLNLEYNRKYNTEPALDAIDDYIAPIKKESPWGYSTPYALSAKCNLHRTYAEYLMGKRRLKTKDIQRILMQVDSNEAELFNESYIEKLYKEYMDVAIDSTPAIEAIKKVCKQRDVLILAPGASITEHIEPILAYVQKKRPLVFAVNFLPPRIAVDFIFCSNARRLDFIMQNKKEESILLTSNLVNDIVWHYDYAVSYNDVAYCADSYCDDSTVMLLNLLKKSGVFSMAIAGFDGTSNETLSFYDENFERNPKSVNSADKIKQILCENFGNNQVNFLTPSRYEECF